MDGRTLTFDFTHRGYRKLEHLVELSGANSPQDVILDAIRFLRVIMDFHMASDYEGAVYYVVGRTQTIEHCLAFRLDGSDIPKSRLQRFLTYTSYKSENHPPGKERHQAEDLKMLEIAIPKGEWNALLYIKDHLLLNTPGEVVSQAINAYHRVYQQITHWRADSIDPVSIFIQVRKRTYRGFGPEKILKEIYFLGNKNNL